ncbi:M56 family metallopeptidase [Prosthecobacter sp.]|uniref:M56 family metallopeptidase n=1 Tax=Prosthecobacter sp. TaxID=1965333 RepID=UPI00248A43FB|nr:M56 family metallopeptidase [Prosthecobacter sp.]MDI1313536.1 M56 family metallopeptidase [Prosthecobacter sp.]
MNPLLFHVIDLLAKSAGIVLLAFATLSLWRSASAAQRCAVWLAAFFVLLLLPFTALWQPLWSIDFAQQSVAPQAALPQLSPVIVQTAASSAAAEPQPWLPAFSMTQWFAFVWLAGVAGLLAHRALGSLQLRRLKSQSHAVQDARVLDATARVAAALGLRRGIALRSSSGVSVPLTWGFIQPVLLLPSSAQEWDAASLEAALRHEMGHIRHCDALTRLITTFITAFYWPNVLVWLAAKAWRTAQEQAADDLVMSGGAVAENYALQLLEAARGVQAAGGLRAPAMAMAQPSTLETRLSAIMDGTRNRSAYSLRGAVAGLVLSCAVMALCATAQLRAVDEKPAQTVGAKGGQKAKADKLIVPKMVVKAASLQQAVAFLQQQSVALDPDHVGLNIMIQDPDYHKGVEISLDLTTVPITEALRYVASLSERVVLYEPYAILISPKTAVGAMVTRSYKLPASTLAKIGKPSEWLIAQGIVFGDGATAAVVAEGSQLLVRNTQAQQDLVESIVSRIADGGVGAATAAEPPAKPLNFLEKKAAAIIIPTVQFRGATVVEAVEFLRVKAKDFDPDKKGVSILIRADEIPQNALITLDLKDVPLIEALRYTAELAGMTLVAEPYAFTLRAKAAK